jgi:hypothetical protein
MGLEQNNEQHYREVVDKYHDPLVDYQMTTRDYVMRPWTDGDTGPIVLTLPPVAEAKGRFYSIITRKADAVNTVTVADKDDSECWGGDIVLNGKCDRLLLYSDGLAWLALTNPGGWPGDLTTAPPGTLAPTTSGATSASATSAAPQ